MIDRTREHASCSSIRALRRNGFAGHTEEVSVQGNEETNAILRDMWNELKAMNGRIDQTNAELAKTNAKLKQTNAKLEQTNAKLEQTNAKLEQTRVELLAEIGVTNAKLDQTREELSAEIGVTNAKLDQTREELRSELVELRTATSSNVNLLARRDARHQSELGELQNRVERIEQHLKLSQTD